MASKYTCIGTMDLVLVLVLALYSAPLVQCGGKILVLVDNINTQDTHSIFFKSLKGTVIYIFLIVWLSDKFL